MTEKEKLQALEVLDEFMSEDGEEFDKKDSKVPTNNIQIAGICIYSASKRI